MLSARRIDEALLASAAAGFEHIELGNRPDFIPAFGAPVTGPSERRRVAGIARDLGVHVASVAVIQAWSSPDERIRRQAVGWWRDGIAAAVALGATRINTELAGDLEHPEASRAAFLRSFDDLRADITDAHVTVAVEPHPNDFVETVALALGIIRDAASPRLRYLHCLPHTYHLGGTAVGQIEMAAGQFDHVHYADTFRPERTILNPPSPRSRVHQHLDPGQGEIDFPTVARALGHTGFEGLLTVQVFAWPDRAEASFAACRGAVEQFAADITTARSVGADLEDDHGG